MSKIAEIAALEAYPEETRFIRDYNQLAKRQIYQQGYEQAEKDTIERVISWVRKNTYIYTDTQNDEEGNLMIAFLEEAFIDDIKKAMNEEQ